MKDKAAIVVLVIVAAGLALGLMTVSDKSRREKQALYDALTIQSNAVITTRTNLTEVQAANRALKANLAAARADFSNSLASCDASLRAAEENLEKVKEEAGTKSEADADEIARRDRRISDLQNQSLSLDKQAAGLRIKIASLEELIAATKEKLAKSDNELEALITERSRLLEEKTALENRFNDLRAVQAQALKLKRAATGARKTEMVLSDLYDQSKMKGGERLINLPQSLFARER